MHINGSRDDCFTSKSEFWPFKPCTDPYFAGTKLEVSLTKQNYNTYILLSANIFTGVHELAFGDAKHVY